MVIGFYVAQVIERRQANKRAAKDVVTDLCGESLDHLSSLSQILEEECMTGQQVSVEARNRITRCLQRFSNSVHSIEFASQKAQLSLSVEALKGHRESLRTQITEPLALGPALDPAMCRQIEGTILQAREAIVEFELSVHLS